jgi:putative sugar O-methyltransferase
MSKTSISDTQKYKNACKMATISDFHFDFFKKDQAYTEILEHVNQEQGQMYKDYLDIHFSDYKTKLDKFKENDIHGSPAVFNYNDIGLISPTTLRYIKVLSDLKNLYGSLDNFNIVEIGVGYGGQCKIITDFFNISKYYLIDLDEATDLALKYLNKLNVSKAEAMRFDEIDTVNLKFDLVISNYAFTELNRDIQDIYLKNIVTQSSRGYITCNFISQYCNINSYSLQELELKLNQFNLKKFQEFPLTHKDNLILCW